MVVKRTDDSVFDILFKTLKSGGVAIIPCDTIYGIVGTVPDAEGKIRCIKGRENKKPFLQLIGSPQAVLKYTDISIYKNVLSLWPGPLTLVFPWGKSRTVALRMPKDRFLLDIIYLLKMPLFSTSVNKSEEKTLWQISSIVDRFEKEVELIIDAGDLPDKKPSTILDVTEKPYKILRQGIFNVPEEYLL